MHLAHGDDSEAFEELALLDLHNKALLLCPVNDAEGMSRADAGSHWTLLMSQPKDPERSEHTCVHLDSLGGGHPLNGGLRSRNAANARRIVSRLSPGAVLEQGQCAKQRNSYDCGVYVLYFIGILLKAFARAASAKGFWSGPGWRRDLLQVQPEQVSALRADIRKMFVDRAQPERGAPVSVAAWAAANAIPETCSACDSMTL